MADVDWFLALNQDPQVMEFALRKDLSDEDIVQMIEQSVQSHTLRGYGLRGCFLKDTQTPVGFCGVCLRELEDLVVPELGYRLFPKFWFQGYATEAALAVMKDALERLKFPQLFSFIRPENTRSIRVAEKIGERFAFHATANGVQIAVYTAMPQAPG
jgi:RimJ/RimL family protein N-acetyltransferase